MLGFWAHAQAMCDRRWSWSWRRHWPLLVEPAAVLALTVTNGWHQQFYSHLERIDADSGRLLPRPEIGFWLHTAYSYALLGWAVLLLLRAAVTASPAHRDRFLWPLLGAFAPIAGNLVSIVLTPEDASLDFTPVFFMITATTCWWALHNEALPDVAPVSLSQVVATISDAALVVDRQGRVLEHNPTAEAMLRHLNPGAPARLVGQPLHVLTGDETMSLEQYVGDPGTLSRGGIDLDLRTAPLTDDRGGAIGWVLVARDVTVQQGQQRELERQRLEAVSANVALREQLALVEELQARLAEQAVRDALTGLHNRHRLVEALEHELPQSLADGRPLSVLMIDVDHFKRVNDNFGHGVGDQLLVAMARALAEDVRPGEVLARFGGEEFVLLMQGCEPTDALERAERARLRCARVSVHAGDAEVATTVSIGMASARVTPETVPGTALQADAVLLAADRALYAAKQSGRDRVVPAEAVGAAA